MGFRGFAAVALICLSAQATLPCGGVYRVGQEAFIASEEAFIVWEPESQTETFIRTANFQGKGADFGFIVPTPSEPELSEVGNNVFTTLRAMVLTRSKYRAGNSSPAGAGGFGGGGGGSVEIVKEQVVAGMKATVLRATDTQALELWLSNNGYPANPAVINWTAYYIKNNYYLTAFKVDRKTESTTVQMSAVKMVFRTKMPIYPYREPASVAKQRSRSLSVYMLAPFEVSARYINTRQPWEARKSYFEDITPEEIEALTKQAKLKPETLPDLPRLNYFVDRNVVRPDYDVVFERKTNSANVRTFIKGAIVYTPLTFVR